MDEEIDRLVVAVRADTTGFASDVASLGASLKTGLGDAADAAGGRVETALARAVTTGKLGFDDLGKVALSVLDSIAQAAVKGAIGGAGGAGLLGGLTSLVSGLLGAPGRATGGPVSPGRAYTVGESGPELFVPTSSGRIEAAGAAQPARLINVSITVNGGGSDAAGALARSGKQVARAVRQALVGAG